MLKPDLSKLNEAERQELIINLLFQNQSMLIALLNREAERMSVGGLVDGQAALEYLQENSSQAKQSQMAAYNLTWVSTEGETSGAAPADV